MTDLVSSAAAGADPDREKPRGFAALHRDAWRILMRAPVALLLLPAEIAIPGAILFVVAIHRNVDLSNVTLAPFGLLSGVIVVARLKMMSERRVPNPGGMARTVVSLLAPLLGVTFAVSWRLSLLSVLLGTTLGLALGFLWDALSPDVAFAALVVGMIAIGLVVLTLAIRWALAAHVAVFEGKRGRHALRGSAAYVAANAATVLSRLLAFALVYGPLAASSGVWLAIAIGRPSAILLYVLGGLSSAIGIVALTVVYVDLRPGWHPDAPLGREVDGSAPVAPGGGRSPRVGVAFASVLSCALLGASLVVGHTLIMAPYRVGVAALARGDDATALAAFERLEPWWTFDPRIAKGMGDALSGLGDIDGAVRWYERLVASEPDSATYRVKLGFAYLLAQRFEDALTELDRHRELTRPPDWLYPVIWKNLALRQLGRPDEAQALLADYARAAELDGWAAVLLRYHLEEISEADLLAAATAPGERCEAEFCVAYERLLAGDRERAQLHLERARAPEALDYLEHDGAGVLLALLDAPPPPVAAAPSD